MSQLVLRPLIAQVIIIVALLVVFTGALTIIGSSPTADVREQVTRNAISTTLPVSPTRLVATATSIPGFGHGLVATPTSIPDYLADNHTAPSQNGTSSQPEPIAVALPAHFSGNGSQVTQPVLLWPGWATFDMRQTKAAIFEVWLMHSNERYALVHGNGTALDGQVRLEINDSGRYTLAVNADGEWAIDVF